MKDLINAKHKLFSEDLTCVLCKNDDIHTSVRRGVQPLVAWLESGGSFVGYSAADRVVGRATAYLYVLLGIKAVYARVISRPALQVLTEHGIQTEYGELVDGIINRQKNGICPFEAAVLDVGDPAEAYEKIREKMKQMNISL